MAQVSDGDRTLILHPEELPDFIWAHRKAQWVGHNVSFDFWVVLKYLEETHRLDMSGRWWNLADHGQIHDTQYLDMLVRLAKGSSGPSESPDLQPRNLAEVAKDYTDLILNKEDPHRTRYQEILGLDWATLNPSWFEYAALDAVATLEAWNGLVGAAKVLGAEEGPYGLLTEQIQTKASIALADIARRGIRLDSSKITQAMERLSTQIWDHIGVLDTQVHGLFKKFKVDRSAKGGPKAGDYKLTSSGLPQQSQGVLIPVLEQAEADMEIHAPKSEKKGQITTSMAWWAEQVGVPEVLTHWIGMGQTTKVYQFLVQLKDHDRVYPKYRTLVRTGRTSASNPNVQQMPREAWFRELFIPSPGYKLAAIDFAAIELRTLAVVCEARFGKSVLADTIRRGVDPHAYTASMVLGIPMDKFMEMKKTNPDGFKLARQQAKAINFGVPGGLGPYRLQGYARSNYGVNMTLGEAKVLRNLLINQVYPELGQYLEHDTIEALAKTTGLSWDDVYDHLASSPLNLHYLTRILERVARGVAQSDPEDRVDMAWDLLRTLTKKMPKTIRDLVKSRSPSMWLSMKIFSPAVQTLTGRIRGDAVFTEARNTPFQGLAADGAKLALWNLCKQGFRVVAFVHDEVVIEVHEASADTEAREASEIMKSSMSEVLGGFPVETEYVVSESWRKP